ncbi:MAG: hypothetical protein J6O49_09515 [Bacteroidaceae bacterium]|nr:hypothetical protein [Bacteroidaceae bacterium]
MRKDERRPKGQVLKPGFTSKLFKELLEGLREQKRLVNYLNKDLGIGWRNLSLKQLRDVPLSILMRIILNYSYMWDREKFIAAGATLAARICGYHWVVLKDGTIQAGRPETIAGAYLRHYNQHAIGICYVGGLDKNGKSADTRTPEQK